MEVYKAISKVSAALASQGIGKNSKNAQQGFKFRGIDDILNALAPILAENQLVIIPRVTNCDRREVTAKSGSTLFYVSLRIDFDLISAEDGSKHTATIEGEAMDSGDKATNKAMSIAYKYMAILTFCIPTEGENDPDYHTHEIASAAKPSNISSPKTIAGSGRPEGWKASY